MSDLPITASEFQTLWMDLLRQGDPDETQDSIQAMEAFLSRTKSMTLDGGALPAAVFEQMEQAGRAFIDQAKMTMVGEALFADLDRALAQNPEGPLAEDLTARMRDYTDLMMQTTAMAVGVQPEDIHETLPGPAQALFEAIEDEDAQAVCRALPKVDVNGQYGRFQRSPLFHAISCLDIGCQMPNLLLDHGADPRIGMCDGHTPLHGVASKRYPDTAQSNVNALVQRLISGGADPEARTHQFEWTPVQVAVSELEPVSLRALLQAGAKVEPTYTAASPACVQGPSVLDGAFAFPDILQLLLEFGADPSRTDQAGRTALERLAHAIAANQASRDDLIARGKTPDKSERAVTVGLEVSFSMLRNLARPN